MSHEDRTSTDPQERDEALEDRLFTYMDTKCDQQHDLITSHKKEFKKKRHVFRLKGTEAQHEFTTERGGTVRGSRPRQRRGKAAPHQTFDVRIGENTGEK